MTRSGPGSGTSRIASFRRMPPTAFVPPPLVGLSRSSASTRVAIKHATLPLRAKSERHVTALYQRHPSLDWPGLPLRPVRENRHPGRDRGRVDELEVHSLRAVFEEAAPPPEHDRMEPESILVDEVVPHQGVREVA